MLRAIIVGAVLAAADALSPGASVAQRSDMGTSHMDSLPTFPKVEGRNLEGRAFRLPDDFEGELNVVLVAFEREHQRDVDSWLPMLGELARSQPEMRVYELPTLGRSYRVMRPMIDGGMRRGIPDRAVREATITLYIDKRPFRAALGIRDEREIVVLLVDRTGRVHWRTDGAYDAAKGDSLQAVIAKR